MSKSKHECTFCFERFDSKREAEEHIKKCPYNPALKTCWSCAYFMPHLPNRREYCAKEVSWHQIRRTYNLACGEHDET